MYVLNNEKGLRYCSFSFPQFDPWGIHISDLFFFYLSLLTWQHGGISIFLFVALLLSVEAVHESGAALCHQLKHKRRSGGGGEGQPVSLWRRWERLTDWYGRGSFNEWSEIFGKIVCVVLIAAGSHTYAQAFSTYVPYKRKKTESRGNLALTVSVSCSP